MTKYINKLKLYENEERSFESIGNILNTKIISFKLYCKSNFKILRYSYLGSFRILMDFMDDESLLNFEEILPSLGDISDYYSFLELDGDLLTENEE